MLPFPTRPADTGAEGKGSLMSAPDDQPARLPDRPSPENLRKQAKGIARREGLGLAAAHQKLARRYGFVDWAAMMRAVAQATRPSRSLLPAAAGCGDVEGVRRLLAEGVAVDGAPDEVDSPLYLACGAEAPAADRIAIARMLIEAGAFVRRGCSGGATPLHVAARRGPADLVELLLRNGALVWQPDGNQRRPFDEARDGAPEGKEKILFMLQDGPRITDPRFAEAVAAIQCGDELRLAVLIDAYPSLLRERAIEPDFGARGYFTDPKLFWFVANNPTLIPASPPNIVAITKLMIARGVAREDLDYALGLVMTNGRMPADTQIDMVRALAEAGATLDEAGLLTSLGHRQTAPIAWLIDHGHPLSAAAAAGLGRIDALPGLLAAASPKVTADALAMSVINREEESVRLCLEAGADPNAFMPCHSHSTPLHQAALHGDLAIMSLLVAHGARTEIADTLWHGTPLGWAIHGGQDEAADWLRGLHGES